MNIFFATKIFKKKKNRSLSVKNNERQPVSYEKSGKSKLMMVVSSPFSQKNNKLMTLQKMNKNRSRRLPLLLIFVAVKNVKKGKEKKENNSRAFTDIVILSLTWESQRKSTYQVIHWKLCCNRSNSWNVIPCIIRKFLSVEKRNCIPDFYLWTQVRDTLTSIESAGDRQYIPSSDTDTWEE